MEKRTVLLIDEGGKTALGIVRTLAKKGVKVIVACQSKFSRARHSKYCASYFLIPPFNKASEEDIHKVILENVRRLRPDVIMPEFDTSYNILLEHKEEYLKYSKLVPLPQKETFHWVNDKALLMKLAKKHKVPIPKTYFPKDLSDLKKISKKLTYPVILKPTLALSGQGTCLVSASEDLITSYKKMTGTKDIRNMIDFTTPIIQEFIPGKLINFFALYDDDKLITTYMMHSFRVYPPPFGPTISGRSIKNKLIKKISLDFIKKFGWNGIINLTYILDERDNIPKLIEINPRLAGSIECLIHSGVDVPYFLYCMAIGKPLPKKIDYKEGEIFRYILFGELFYLLKTKDKLKTLREYFNFRNTRCEIDFGDLKPHLIHFLDVIRKPHEVINIKNHYHITVC